jgi:glycosyltransferase involved in cell wall biosynthesis
MRILTIVRRLTPGGTERAAQNCSIAYAKHGQEVAVLAYEAGGPRAETLDAAGVPVFIGGSSAAELDRAVRQAAAWGPELVHIHRPGHTHHLSADILRRLKQTPSRRLPVVETNHFARVDRSRDRSLIDVHMLLSRWCLWKWQGWARGLHPPPLGIVMPHIVDGESFYPAGAEVRASFRAEYGIPADALVYGRVGQPMVGKWSSAAFKAFRETASASPEAWLVIVGAPDKYRSMVQRWSEELRNRVVDIPFLHGDDMLRACYSAMDVFLHGSRIGESFGLVLAEAMLCQRPVVTLSTPLHDNSQLEVVGHERGGLIAANMVGMARAMQRLARNPEERARLAEQGRRWCLEQYAADRIASRMLRLMDHVLRADSPVHLEQALEVDETFTTHVSRGEIEQLLVDAVGRCGVGQRLLLELAHVPWLHRSYGRVKAIARRFGVGPE